MNKALGVVELEVLWIRYGVYRMLKFRWAQLLPIFLDLSWIRIEENIRYSIVMITWFSFYAMADSAFRRLMSPYWVWTVVGNSKIICKYSSVCRDRKEADYLHLFCYFVKMGENVALPNQTHPVEKLLLGFCNLSLGISDNHCMSSRKQ